MQNMQRTSKTQQLENETPDLKMDKRPGHPTKEIWMEVSI